MAGLADLTEAERAALAAAVRPVDRAAVITAIADRLGTLPPDLAATRWQVLATEAAEGRKLSWLAMKIGCSPSRVSRLVRRYRPATEGATS